MVIAGAGLCILGNSGGGGDIIYLAIDDTLVLRASKKHPPARSTNTVTNQT